MGDLSKLEKEMIDNGWREQHGYWWFENTRAMAFPDARRLYLETTKRGL